MMKKDMTTGSPLKLIIAFGIPLVIGNIFQQFYSMVDTIIVGKYVGKTALAAVGSTGSLNFMIIGFGIGICSGFGIPIAQSFGGKKIQDMKKYIVNSFYLCMLITAIMTIATVIALPSVLELMQTPSDIYQQAYDYIVVIFIGLFATMLYNILSSILRAIGDSRTPLYFLIGSSIGNIILDYIFVAKLYLGVAGVAWATFIAQGGAAILALITMSVRLRHISNEKQPFVDKQLLWQIIEIAVPSIIQQSVLSVGNLFVQDIVNRFGSSVIAGYSGAIKLNTFAINTFMCLGSCLSSYTAQNIGAGKQERIPLGFKTGVKLSEITVIPFFILYFIFSRQMMGLFLDDGSMEAIQAGISFLRIVSPLYFIIAVKLMTDGIIRGAGAMMYFIIATVPDLILRICFALVLSSRFGSTGIWMAWPFGWIVATVLTIIFYQKVKNGKVKE